MNIIQGFLNKLVAWLLGYSGSTKVGVHQDESLEATHEQCSKEHVSNIITRFEDDISSIESKFKTSDSDSTKKDVDELLNDLNTSLDQTKK